MTYKYEIERLARDKQHYIQLQAIAKHLNYNVRWNQKTIDYLNNRLACHDVLLDNLYSIDKDSWKIELYFKCSILCVVLTCTGPCHRYIRPLQGFISIES